MGVPTLEKAPGGLKEPWLGIWRATLKQLQEQDTWQVAQRPLLDEYVLALRAAANARTSAESAVAWDKHSKRALALADALGLTPKAQKALRAKSKEDGSGEQSPFEDLDGDVVPLAPRRRQRNKAS